MRSRMARLVLNSAEKSLRSRTSSWQYDNALTSACRAWSWTQRHLAEELALREQESLTGGENFHHAGRDEVHRVAGFARRDQALRRNRESRSQQPDDGVEMLAVQAGEHRHARQERASLEAEVESRARIHGRPCRRQVPLERAVELRSDDALVEELLVLERLAAKRHTSQKPFFEQGRVRRILGFERFERGVRHLLALV